MVKKELDRSAYPKPVGVPDYVWDIVDHAELLEQWPHPPQIIAHPYSGNTQLGNEKSHKWQISVRSWHWISADETGYGWGNWVPDDGIPLSDWLSPNQIGPSINYEGQTLPIIKEDSHGCCPECVPIG